MGSSKNGSPMLAGDPDGPAAGPPVAVVVIGRPPRLILFTATFMFIGFLAVLLVGLWITGSEAGSSDFGIRWADPEAPELMFNYHPLFMVLGVLYLHGITNLLYRLFPTSNYLYIRIIHAILQLMALILLFLAFYAVYFFKEHTDDTDIEVGHFVSTHSWIGLIVMIIFSLQFLCGFLGLLVPGLRGAALEQYRATHRFFGCFVFLLACTNALVGLDQMVSSLILNTLGLVIVAYAANGFYILANKDFRRGMPALEAVEGTAEERMPILLRSPGTPDPEIE